VKQPKIIVAGGGAAGFFAAITAAESGARVALLEKGAHFLAKVRISGGGRCNVTNACGDPREMSLRYPRGGRALIGAFRRFGQADTVAWFAARGAKLKAEPDGRMFPVTDSSETIVECLVNAARGAGVEMRTHCGVASVKRRDAGGFAVILENGETLECDRLLLATGGCRAAAMGAIPISLGHTLVEPVPSLFTFQITTPWLRELAGVCVADAEVSVPGAGLRERGPVLVTHWGLSGPAILRLSAWGARKLHAQSYKFPMLVNWVPARNAERLAFEFQTLRVRRGAKLVANLPVAPLPARLWERLVAKAGVENETRWSALKREQQTRLLGLLTRAEFSVTGKSLNKDEFVTCGGVNLPEVDLKSMESRVCPGLFFAGELLDIDGITGGFNFQAAWTTGWIAGRAMAGA
jgi:predicted Rossmann fold flavoprotein